MNHEALLLTSVVCLALAVIGLIGILIICLWQAPKRLEAALLARVENLPSRRESMACLGPIEAVSFADSLDPEKFADVAEKSAYIIMTEQLQDCLADGVTVVVNGLRLLSSRTELIVTASKKGRQLLNKGAQ